MFEGAATMFEEIGYRLEAIMSADFEDLQEYLQSWVEFFRKRPTLLLSLGMMMYRLYTSTRPIPDHGGNVQAINSKEELVAALESAAKEKKAAVVDFYADWCGPCKQIAPDYARLSEEGAYKRAIFLKVNVDKARDAMQYAEVECMPTFKVYAKGTKDAPETVEGADMKQVKAALDQ